MAKVDNFIFGVFYCILNIKEFTVTLNVCIYNFYNGSKISINEINYFYIWVHKKSINF